MGGGGGMSRFLMHERHGNNEADLDEFSGSR